MNRSHNLIIVLLGLLLAVVFTSCAAAAEIRPLEINPDETDLNNGTFCLAISDPDRIDDGGFFTAELFLEDRYDAGQVKSLAPGDTVWINGTAWTVGEVDVHESLRPGEENVYEICPEEEYFGYMAFRPWTDGTFCAVVDDWIPVTAVGEMRVVLPLPEQFTYIAISAGEEEEPRDMNIFLEHLMMFGGFNAYNTSCVIENGLLTGITHSSYPQGPEEYWPSDQEPSPASQEEIPVWQFCRGNPDLLDTAVITCSMLDCEAGPVPSAITSEQAEQLRTLAVYGVVIGRENDEMVTGGTWLYSFETPDGEHIMTVELYKGLLVGPDGMYACEIRR